MKMTIAQWFLLEKGFIAWMGVT